MDDVYFDLFIKYKDAEKEIVWERALTWPAVEMYLQMLNRLNKKDIELFGKSRIEYFRIE